MSSTQPLNPGPEPVKPAPIIAKALVCNGHTASRWIELDEQQYLAMTKRAAEYSVFADQLRHFVRKTGKLEQNIPDSYFSTIASAINSRGIFDPNVSGPDLVSGKQIFQRARSVFDARTGNGPWRMFRGFRHEEGHTVYAFQPDHDVSFAFVFLPED